MKSKLILPLLIFLFFSECGTTVKIPVMSRAPEGFMEFMRGGRDIGIYVYKSGSTSFNDASSDWRTTVYGSVLNSIQSRRYFRIVDLSSRQARLQEVAFSQKIGGMKDISKELSVDGLLFIEVPQSPVSECKSSTNTSTKRECGAYDKNGNCVSWQNKTIVEFRKELIYTVYAKGRLVNLETGQSQEYTNSTPAILKNVSNLPHVSCPSQQEGFNRALKIASDLISDHLSPTMEDMDVPIYDDADGVVDSDIKSKVKDSLKGGNKWLDTDAPNLEFAKEQWEKALSVSNNNSASAHWNMAIYYWAKGNVESADSHFNQAMRKGGPDWMNSKKMDIISKFQEEKKRIKMEKASDGE